jgi:hypothetical protein
MTPAPLDFSAIGAGLLAYAISVLSAVVLGSSSTG